MTETDLNEIGKCICDIPGTFDHRWPLPKKKKTYKS